MGGASSSTKNEKTPLKEPLSGTAEQIGVTISSADHAVGSSISTTFTKAEKILAVLLYGHVVKKTEEKGCCGLKVTLFDTFLVVIHSTLWRFISYLTILASVITLAYQVRSINEMYLTKHVADTFVHNHFDSSHNTFLDIRRQPDFWEWGNNVLIPGLLGNNGPCNGEFSWSLATAPVGSIAASLLAARSKCVEGWPDGTYSFSTHDATSYTPFEWAAYMDDIDWTDGLTVRTVRVKSVADTTDQCHGATYTESCRPEIVTSMSALDASLIDSAAYGIGSPPPFTYQSARALGTQPTRSGHVASVGVSIPGDGYLASIQPFFAERFIPEARGLATDVPFDTTTAGTPIVTRTNGKTPNFFCVRTSMDGLSVTQICDPNTNTTGRTTGVVRAAAEAWWNDLKRAHFVDFNTRAIVLTMMLRANNMGVTSRTSYNLEVTAAGAILPSFGHHTTVSAFLREGHELLDTPEGARYQSFKLWANIALVISIYFALMELIEMYSFGLVQYFASMWNIFDLVCIIVYFFFYSISQFGSQIAGSRNSALQYDQCSTFCQQIGIYDNVEAFGSIIWMRDLLSTTGLILLLKSIKFVNYYFPSTGLLVKVLSRGRNDLIIFTIIFSISVFAFAFCFWLRLGSQIDAFSTLSMSFLTVFRALFGDYDLDTISEQFHPLSNSVILFVFFAFLNIFIVLSIFLAILGEAQGAVRAREAEEAAKGVMAKEKKQKRKQRALEVQAEAEAKAAQEATLSGVVSDKASELLSHGGAIIDMMTKKGITAEEMEGDDEFLVLNPKVLVTTVKDYFAKVKVVHEQMAKEAAGETEEEARADEPDTSSVSGLSTTKRLILGESKGGAEDDTSSVRGGTMWNPNSSISAVDVQNAVDLALAQHSSSLSDTVAKLAQLEARLNAKMAALR